MHDFGFLFLALLAELLEFCSGLRVVGHSVMSRHVWLCLAECLDMTRRVLIGFLREINRLQQFGDALLGGIFINQSFKVLFSLNAQAF